ncbi:hypothetical protein [Henriciella mobilis]|uniref:hypothetical protein n=1 Tax=Henriciella mobilis TaxID=2305467 RepID=UPI0011C49967|nr:hypothetical protein [Henriciella mobilis]
MTDWLPGSYLGLGPEFALEQRKLTSATSRQFIESLPHQHDFGSTKFADNQKKWGEIAGQIRGKRTFKDQIPNSQQSLWSLQIVDFIRKKSGTPERIRTSDPQIRSLRIKPDMQAGLPPDILEGC